MHEVKEVVLERLRASSRAEVKEVAVAVGLSFQGLQKLRTGERTDPYFSTVAKLARHYHLRADDCTGCDGARS